MISIVVTRDFIHDTFTVTATNYETDVSVKSTLWPTEEEAKAEAWRIELSWKYGTSAPMARGGAA
jgi:hypothetical protein